LLFALQNQVFAQDKIESNPQVVKRENYEINYLGNMNIGEFNDVYKDDPKNNQILEIKLLKDEKLPGLILQFFFLMVQKKYTLRLLKFLIFYSEDTLQSLIINVIYKYNTLYIFISLIL
jgi:hypothetical protein